MFEQEQAVELHTLPDTIWKHILSYITSDVPQVQQSVSEWENITITIAGMQRILPLTRTNRSCRFKVYELIAQHILQVLLHVNLVGKDFNETLFNIVTNASRLRRADRIKLARFCCLLGADINSNNFFQGQLTGETLLTAAVIKHAYQEVEDILKMGAQSTQPNIKGETPIELASAQYQYKIGALLKDNGADPENKFTFNERFNMIIRKWDFQYVKDQGRTCLIRKSAEKERLVQPAAQQVVAQQNSHNNSITTTHSSCCVETQTLPSEELISPHPKSKLLVMSGLLLGGASVGAIVGGLCVWMYSKWKCKNKKAPVKSKNLTPDVKVIFI
jgi:hypothetical protein